MRGILKPLYQSPGFKRLARGLADNLPQQLVYGLSGSQRSYLLAGLAEEIAPLPLLILTPGETEAGVLADELSALLPAVPVRHFPVWQLLPYQVLAQGREVPAQRLRVLEGLAAGERMVVVAPAEALLRRLMPPRDFTAAAVSLEEGQRIEPDQLLQSLVTLGYERVEMVEGRGQFSRRGGIIDIFPMTAHRPARVDFFDDEVESVRCFNVTTQRSEEKVKSLLVYPCREFIARAKNRDDAVKALEKEYASQARKLERAGEPAALRQQDEVFARLRQAAEEPGGGSEQLLPYFYGEVSTLLDYLPGPGPVAVEEPARLKEVIDSVLRERAETYTGLLAGGKVLPSQFKCYTGWDHISRSLSSCRAVYLSLLPRQPLLRPGNTISLAGSKTMPNFFGNMEMLTREINQWRKSGNAVVILATSHQRAQKIVADLQDRQIDAFFAGNPEGHLRAGNVLVTLGSLSSGFELGESRLAVLTEANIYGQLKKPRKKMRQAERLAPFTDLKTGDYVVHVNHGIGRYLGVKPLTIGGIRKEYLLVKYAGEDKLYVPVDQVGQIQKYFGSEGEAPRLSRLGGSEWARTKSKVREAVKEMAQDLLVLYAARETLKGHAFGPDTLWQQEFEDSFPYEETPDQLRAMSEVKEDMEKSRPMDRLLCGDVGYGKTEVALRAAFKTVMEGKQVAVLVPTTILAQQHFHTFKERMAGFPINVDVLSRFRSAREQGQVLKGLARGTVDIVVGTHRLLQEDVRFKDLGLLVVDEEQRFGVAHKEKLKFKYRLVDVLTLTATPIPRTLHMSLAGVRDTSILETPPEGRFPVQTFVLEEEPVLLREAVRRELARGGQVFFVYNRIIDIQRVSAWLQGLVPEARIAVAHGQIREEELEQIMLDFVDNDIDILVCTSIIENGLDIPNVNTLIVKEAEMMGLAQLYQLKGRIGRSSRLAYAYFTYRRERVLGEAAEKRLSAIREFTELGSGFKIAMRDLEIRGAGNILGSEQHGHIAAVGFDLYSRLLEEAVAEARGEQVPRPPEISMELPVEAYIPDQFVSNADQKVDLYKRLAGLESPAELADLAEEMADRFGEPPEPVHNLLAVARVRLLAGRLRAKTISCPPGQLRLLFGPGHNLTGEVLVAAGKKYPKRLKFLNSGEEFEIKLRLSDSSQDGRAVLADLEELLALLGTGLEAPGEAQGGVTGAF